MNRQRGCTGVNSYERELKFDPLAWLTSRLETQKSVAWLDLCCGEAHALVDAAAVLPVDRVTLMGIDLVDFFHPNASSHPNIRLIVEPLLDAEFKQRFDLITCVHGLHYVGDKLAAILKYSALLKSAGLMVANLDTHDFFDHGAKTLSRQLNRLLRGAGCEYDTQDKIIRTTSAILKTRTCIFSRCWRSASDVPSSESFSSRRAYFRAQEIYGQLCSFFYLLRTCMKNIRL